jgi:hypothetical protein
MKKLLSLIVYTFAMVSLVSAAAVTTDVAYKTKVFDRGNVVFENTVVAGVNVEALGFVAGVNTFNPIESNTVAGKTASSGLLKRVDLVAGYKFTAPLANLTLGGVYKNFSKSIQLNNVSSNTDVFAKLDGKLYGTLLTWDAIATGDLKNRSNNVEVNARWPLGVNNFKVVPAIGFGFNDPGTATITAFKNVKSYTVVGVGAGYYGNFGHLSAGWYQRRDTLTNASGQVNGLSVGVHFKL